MGRASRWAVGLALAGGLIGCGGKPSAGPDASGGGQQARLTGAGATFPALLYQKWFSDYDRETGVRINYQAIGSGGGIRQISSGTVDFGASDAPMSDDELRKAGRPILHLPTVLGAVVLTYHVPGIATGLRLTGPTVADIFLGRIKRWNDPAIASVNPTLRLPDRPIAIIRRADGSGTTAVFTDYLSKVSPDWRERVGAGKAVSWPTGLGARGNEGVAGRVDATVGAIGYIEMTYASVNQMPVASLRNAAGRFIPPTVESVTAAGTGMDLPADLRMSVTDSPGPDAYPISAFTYLLVPQTIADSSKGRALVTFIHWALHHGSGSATDLHYAPLPAPVLARTETLLGSITDPSGAALLTAPVDSGGAR